VGGGFASEGNRRLGEDFQLGDLESEVHGGCRFYERFTCALVPVQRVLASVIVRRVVCGEFCGDFG